jgi:hypothetical protein
LTRLMVLKYALNPGIGLLDALIQGRQFRRKRL